ncbi:hypothetical protein KKF70_03100 [bacterium]|nr:hypothetical protein [bacterium]MBU3930613.1 hypothetical protein [bacterium]MBU4122598.1 hypothetical protein [bacterium]
MDFVKEFFQFAWEGKKYWLIPMGMILLFLSIFIIFFESAAVAPFIYTLF